MIFLEWWRQLFPARSEMAEPLTYCVADYKRHDYRGRTHCARCGAAKKRR